MGPDKSDLELLNQARDRARKLLDNLVRHQAELDANPPALAPDQLKEGRQAMQNVIASATRMLQSIEAALASAPDYSDGMAYGGADTSEN
jgi:hypothetical protein